MFGFVVSFLVGLVCVIMGKVIFSGNISVLHSYHIEKVSEEDRIPFGKRVGFGMILMGFAIILFSVFSCIAISLEKYVLLYIGLGILFVGLILAFVMMFSALIRYNKGVF